MRAAIGVLIVLTISVVGCDRPSETASLDCRQNSVELLVQDDREMVEIHRRSEKDFGARWLEHKRCLAEQGDAEAQLSVAVAYRDGDAIPQDYNQATIWFRRAAESGQPMAQFNLGALYEHGRGVPQDYLQAHFWYNVAAAGFGSSDRTRVEALERRDELAARMTSQQVAAAQMTCPLRLGPVTMGV